MTNRDLFHATMRFENGDALLHFEQGFMIPYEDWRRDGLPDGTTNTHWPKIEATPELFDHLNVSGFAFFWFNQFAVPPFGSRILREENGVRTEINANGATVQTMIGGSGQPHGSPPHEIDFAIKTPGDYAANRHRFIGRIEQRWGPDWIRDRAPVLRDQQDFIVCPWVHGPFAYLRELVGTEHAMILPYTEPEMIRLMLRDHLETSMAAAEPLIRAARPDAGFVWEDCCGRSGPFIAPDIFRTMFAPWYRAWKDYLLSLGVPWIILDTDGQPGAVAPLWYDAGVDCILPWEVNCSDMLAFAAEHPRKVLLGGIYKHMFEPGDPAQVGRFASSDVHAAIDAELARVLKPLKKRGGYIASLDHWAFWGVHYRDFLYYEQQLTERYGKANRAMRAGLKPETRNLESQAWQT
jgi:uroporphyrinogen decarboxylase